MSVYTYPNGFAVGLVINKINTDIDFYNVGGVFSPLFGSQLTRDWCVLELKTNNANFSRIKLNFVSVPTSNKEEATGKFTIEYFNGSWNEEDLLTGVEINHARNFSSWRRDVIHWNYDSDTNTIFEIWNYNHSGSKTFSSQVGKILEINTNQTDAIHYII